MIVVLAAAMAVFHFAKPICLRFTAEDDFAGRRNVWFALTFVAFMSPSFWLFVVVAMPVLAWSAHKDTNPVAFYLLVMHLISPNVVFDLPVVAVNRLFELDLYRILAVVALVPAAFRLMRSPARPGSERPIWSTPALEVLVPATPQLTRSPAQPRPDRLLRTDVLIVGYGVLLLVLSMPYESETNTTRRAFLFVVDVLVVYFVVSRTCTSRRAISDALASLCLAAAIFAPLAVIETLKGWLLYLPIAEKWGASAAWDWLLRGGRLRAQVSVGHSLALGYLLAIALGFWLYLSSRVQSKPLAILGVVWIWAGLLAAYARAPWLVAAAIFFAYLALGPNGTARVSGALLASALAAGAILALPIGERILDNLPFVGTVDAENIAFRQQLAAKSWGLIQENPFFGDPLVMLRLESLRNAQDTIDLVNSYAAVAMFHGLVGLCLFLAPFLVGMWNSRRVMKQTTDPDLSLLGAALIACMFGTLLMMATGSFGTILAKMFYVLAGIAAGYTQVGQVATRTRPDHSVAPGPQSPLTTGQATNEVRGAPAQARTITRDSL